MAPDRWKLLFAQWMQQSQQAWLDQRPLTVPTVGEEGKLALSAENARIQRCTTTWRAEKTKLLKRSVWLRSLYVEPGKEYTKLTLLALVQSLFLAAGQSWQAEAEEHRQLILAPTPSGQLGIADLLSPASPASHNLPTGPGWVDVKASPLRLLETRPRIFNPAQAVAYADIYWNTTPGDFPYIPGDNCTNYVSQCLHAGGLPMQATADPLRGWWYREGASPRWSNSWAVAHAQYWYLRKLRSPYCRVQPVYDLKLLVPGDVICYDWDARGIWQHSALITGNNPLQAPLVNSHSALRKNSDWRLLDSLSWTPKIRYGFLHFAPG